MASYLKQVKPLIACVKSGTWHVLLEWVDVGHIDQWRGGAGGCLTLTSLTNSWRSSGFGLRGSTTTGVSLIIALRISGKFQSHLSFVSFLFISLPSLLKWTRRTHVPLICFLLPKTYKNVTADQNYVLLNFKNHSVELEL